MLDILKRKPELEKIFFEVAEVAQYLWQNGWAERNAGNISVNINQWIEKDDFGDFSEYPKYQLHMKYVELAGMFFFITGTGKRMRDLAKEPLQNALIARIADDGCSYTIISRYKLDAYQFKPTSELPTHLGIHQLIAQRKSHEKVIIHTHANELVALTHHPELKSTVPINKLLWGMHPEAMVFVPKGIGYVPYTVPGSEDIASETKIALQHHDMVLWEKHGVLSIGETVLDTFDSIDIMCKSAKIYFMCRSAGFIPEGLDESQLNELKLLLQQLK